MGGEKPPLTNLIPGPSRAARATINCAGEHIPRLPPHRLARRGIARTFQAIRLFKGLTVLENVLVGGFVRGSSPVKAKRLLERLELTARADALAGELAYGDQRRLQDSPALPAGTPLPVLLATARRR